MIYYLGYYSCKQIEAEKRVAAPPAMNKMGYIISALSECTKEAFVIVSPSETSLHRYVKGRRHVLRNGICLQTMDSFQHKCRLIRGFGHMWTKTQLLLFLLAHVKAEDTVIVYHSLALTSIIKILKKIKKCNLIIEVEELYSDVKEDDVLRKKELDYLQIADRYIMITELLNQQVNLQNKPRIISHGTYKTIPDYGTKFNDSKTHVVYAGSFNPIKGGVHSAIKAAEFLDENYVLHILGSGSSIENETVIKRIEQISAKTSCKIIYDGYKSGKDFDSFIQSCHIGLSTQQPDGKYNASSFPSKVLMYMSNGLPVVSVRIPAVEKSNIGSYVYYYDNPTPQEIAKAIKSVSINNNYNIREKLNELDQAFKIALANLLV